MSKNIFGRRAIAAAVLGVAFLVESQAATATFERGTTTNGLYWKGGSETSPYNNWKWGVAGDTGFENGLVSGHWMYGAGGVSDLVVSVSPSVGTMDFNGTYITAGWRNGLSVSVAGYLDNALIYSKTVVVDVYEPTYFDFSFAGVDKLVFHSYGGISAGYSSSYFFYMDNFVYNEPSGYMPPGWSPSNPTPDPDPNPNPTVPVPEPTTPLLLGIGLAGVAVEKNWRSKRRAAQVVVA